MPIIRRKKVNYKICSWLMSGLFLISAGQSFADPNKQTEQQEWTKLGPGAGLYHEGQRGPVCWQEKVDGESEEHAAIFRIRLLPHSHDSFLLSGALIFFRDIENQTVFPVFGSLELWKGQSSEDTPKGGVLISMTMNYPPEGGISGTTQWVARDLNPGTLSGRFHATSSGIVVTDEEQSPFSAAFSGTLRYLGACR